MLFYILGSVTISFLPLNLFLLVLQAVGIIAAVGNSVKHLEVGTPAAVMTFGSYAEFTTVRYLGSWKHYLIVLHRGSLVINFVHL